MSWKFDWQSLLCKLYEPGMCEEFVWITTKYYKIDYWKYCYSLQTFEQTHCFEKFIAKNRPYWRLQNVQSTVLNKTKNWCFCKICKCYIIDKFYFQQADSDSGEIVSCICYELR